MRRSFNILFSVGAVFIAGCSDSTAPQSCVSVADATDGRLKLISSPRSYEYTTCGGGTIQFSRGTIMIGHLDYKNPFALELWGDDFDVGGTSRFIHENLNGKHIKNGEGTIRTIIFPDGAKITVGKFDPEGAGYRLSIYDDRVLHVFDIETMQLTHSSRSRGDIAKIDAQEPDGEASEFRFTKDGLVWENIYNEFIPGSRVNNRKVLGSLELDKPKQINDYYDDPRIGHT